MPYQTEEQKHSSEEYKKLRQLEVFHWYVKGARQMVMRLEEELGPKTALDKAIFKLLKECDYLALEKFLLHDFDEIRFKNHVIKKGYKRKPGYPIPESAYESVEAYMGDKKEFWVDANTTESNL